MYFTVLPSSAKTYSDTIFGFSFSYPQSWNVSTDANGTLSVGLPNSNVAPITVKKTSGTGTDSNGKFGSVIVSFNGSQWVRQQSNERDGGLTSPTPTNPVLYTASGLPIFSGAILTHGWGIYSYIVALSHTKFLTIEGSDNSVDGPYNQDNDPTLSFVKTVKAQQTEKVQVYVNVVDREGNPFKPDKVEWYYPPVNGQATQYPAICTNETCTRWSVTGATASKIYVVANYKKPSPPGAACFSQAYDAKPVELSSVSTEITLTMGLESYCY